MSKITFIEGGVCAPQGFTANGMRVGIKASRKINDTALVFSECPCNAAGVFTQNKVQSESVKLAKKFIANGRAQAAIEISGNANTCTGAQGAENALRMAKAAAKALSIDTEDVIVYSTGVIGAQFDVTKVENNIQQLKDGLSKKGHEEARIAIMTTDTHYKECAVEFEIGGKTCRMGTMCKGSGMIHINMGTMLSFITTDCAISSKMLDKALHSSILETYNCVSVDGDTSTNDTVLILSNGQSNTGKLNSKDLEIFQQALNEVTLTLAKKMASDGEGATRMIEVFVSNARKQEDAAKIASTIATSPLVKTAFFGSDANWGRILAALGRSGVKVNPDKVDIYIGNILTAKDGMAVKFDEKKAKKILQQKEFKIVIDLKSGKQSASYYTCDFSYDYVKINGSYRS